MNNNGVGTLHLFGMDAIDFARSFFLSTDDEIIAHKEVYNRIKSNINISNTKNGFEAEILDLDLSFINN